MSSNYYRARRRKKSRTRVILSYTNWVAFFVFNIVSIGGLLYLHQTNQLDAILDPINKFYQAIGLK